MPTPSPGTNPSARLSNVWQRPPWIERRHRAHFLSGDRYHPSGAGYAVWADRVAHAFDLALRPA